MKTEAHLTSARTTSLLILLLVYLSLDQTMSFYRNAKWLHIARDAFAASVVLKLPNRTQEAALVIVNEQEVPGIDDIRALPMGQRTCTDAFGGEVRAVPLTRVVVTRVDGRRWQSDQAWCLVPPDVDLLTESIRRVARDLHLDGASTADLKKLFGDVEHELIDRRVDVGPLGFALRADLTPWVVGPLVVGLLGLMRNNVRSVVSDPTCALEEPWLVVDDCIGLERLVAAIWLWSIALAPWVSGAAVVAMLASRVYADGSVAATLTNLTLAFIPVGLLVTGGWLGLTLVSDLVALRHRRLRLRVAT